MMPLEDPIANKDPADAEGLLKQMLEITVPSTDAVNPTREMVSCDELDSSTVSKLEIEEEGELSGLVPRKIFLAVRSIVTAR